MLTAEVVLIGAVRVLGSLPVLRWPFAGALLAIVVDLSDLFLMNLLDLGGIPDYQSFDKWVDQVYMATFLLVALRWSGIERRIAVGLYLFRLVGFLAFEATGERLLLIAFPNVFEVWFVIVAAIHARRLAPEWTGRQLAAALGVALVVKEVQEWAIHGARLFDDITAIDAVREIWRRLGGG